MSKLFSVFLATLAFAIAASAQIGVVSDDYQVRYFANPTLGGYVNITNTGAQGASAPTGTICANVYVFDPAQEIISCCTCPVIPNGLVHLSAPTDLIGNTLTIGVPSSITVALVATLQAGGTCNAATEIAGDLVGGLRAWGTTLHALPSPPGGYALTETAFSDAALSLSELQRMEGTCAWIQSDGSTHGICGSCVPGSGALGAAKE